MSAPSPFKGLRVFEDSDTDVPFFFGRDRERGLLEANLMASRLTVLYGETGVGKSSLLRAGVAHHMRGLASANLEQRGEPEHAIVVFGDWRDDPVDALRRACAEEVTRALGGTLSPPDETTVPLAESLHLWQQLLGGDLYVILDQVEEYFLYHQGEEGPGSFAAEFPAVIAATDLRVNVLLAIREDALAKLDAFKARIPNVLGNYLRLEHLGRDAARAAIVGPVERYNQIAGAGATVELEPALVDAVLDEVANVTGEWIETPHLQLVMQRLWDEEQALGSRALRLETLRALGGAARIVGDHVDRALASLTPAEQDYAAAMFDHLVTPSGTKIALELDDLARYAGAPRAAAVAMLEKLGADRIVRSVEGGRYEIFHDVLARPVLAWKSDHDAARAHRRLVRVVALASAAVAVMAGITVFAVLQRSDARSQARIAGARALASQALSELQADPQLSLRLAAESAQKDATPAAENVLRQALIASHERRILRTGSPVSAVAFAPGGSLVVSASDDGAARIWRRDGTLLHTLHQRGAATAAAFSPDGTLVLTASTDGAARIWRAATGELLETLHHGGPVSSARFDAGGMRIVTASADGTVRTWTRAGEPLVTARLPGPVTSAALSDSGRLLLAVAGRRAFVLDARSGARLHELGARGVISAAFNPRGTKVATGSLDHTAAIWSSWNGKLLHLLGRHNGAVTDVLFGPRGRLLVTTSDDGATRVFSAVTGERSALMLGHANAVVDAVFSPDGKYLATASTDGSARVWEPVGGRIRAVLRGHGDRVVAVAFSPDGGTVATASADGTARLWDAGTAPELRPLLTVRGAVRTVSVSPDGRSFLEAGDDGDVRIVTGETTRVLRHPAAVTSALFSPDGRLVLSADADRTVRIWDAATGTLARSAEGLSAGPLALSADGRRLALPTATGAIAIVDAATLQTLRVMRADAPLTTAAFSPAGDLVATGAGDGKVWLWALPGGALTATLRGHDGAVTDVVFSRDGRLLATSSRDHDARVWDVKARTSIVLRGHFGPVFGVALSPDGRTAVTAGPITAGLWSTADGRLLTYLRGDTGALTGVSYTPDGRTILTASRDGSLRTYRCELCGGPDELVAAAQQRLAALG